MGRVQTAGDQVPSRPERGGHWGVPNTVIPLEKNTEIPLENRLNTDTAYFNHIYNRFRVLMVASI